MSMCFVDVLIFFLAERKIPIPSFRHEGGKGEEEKEKKRKEKKKRERKEREGEEMRAD